MYRCFRDLGHLASCFREMKMPKGCKHNSFPLKFLLFFRLLIPNDTVLKAVELIIFQEAIKRKLG